MDLRGRGLPIQCMRMLDVDVVQCRGQAIVIHHPLRCLNCPFSPVLLVEVVHVRHEVLDDVHVGQRVDLGLLVVGLDLADAGERVDAANVHRAGAADALAAGAAEGQGGVHLVLDLDQRVQDHGAAVVQVDLVLLWKRYSFISL